MTNDGKYLNIFKDVFDLKEDGKIRNLKYQEIPEWDSVGHMELISEIEDAFDIEMETSDIIDFSGYEKGKEILSSQYGIKFD